MTSSPKWPIHGYAIVCQNDCIADETGEMPDSLRNDADWQYFQSELDTCAVTILGRRSHEAAPNPKSRLRVVMSGQAQGLEQRSDAWWWNPADLPVSSVLEQVAPNGGKIAVPGGQGPFDYFLAYGFSGFHLARAESVLLTGGTKLFSNLDAGSSVERVLTQAGLTPSPVQVLDASEPVTMRVWRSL